MVDAYEQGGAGVMSDSGTCEKEGGQWAEGMTGT